MTVQIIYNDIKEAEALSNLLNEKVKHLHDKKTLQYTYVCNHPTEKKYAVRINTKDKYYSVVEKEIKGLKAGEITEDWFNKE